MADIEKVIYDIERCICHVPDVCRDCSHYGFDHSMECMESLLKDALELLKKQEEVEPYITGSGESFETAETWWYECGNCNKPIDPNDKFCRYCGRSVKWE